MSASFSIFSIGMLRVITAASAPSASTQAAPSLRPTSRASVANCTPVHSDVLSRPCVPCTVFSVGLFHSVSPLPEHSMKCLRVTDGKRLMSAIENFFGRVDHAVNEKPMLGRIDGRDAAVMPLEMQARRA